jgi:hypothetical protein
MPKIRALNETYGMHWTLGLPEDHTSGSIYTAPDPVSVGGSLGGTPGPESPTPGRLGFT